jgi:hypothetical protein
MTSILIGLLLFVGATVVPQRALARVSHGGAPAVRLGVAAAGLSLVLGTLVTLLSSS